MTRECLAECPPSQTKGEPETTPMVSTATTMVFRGTVRAFFDKYFFFLVGYK